MSDPVKYQGSAIKTLAPKEIWQRGRGYQTVKRYEGTKAAIYAFKGTLYTGSGGSLESFECYQQGGKYILDVYSASKIDGSTSDDDNEAQANPLWELEPEEIESDLKTHSAFSGITANRFAILDAMIDAGTATSTSGASETENNYIKMRLKGTETFLLASYRLRRTWTVNSRSGLRASFTLVNHVDVPDVAGALFNLGDIPEGEWLKMAPVVVKISKQKWEITQEWLWAEEWSALLYGGSGSP